MYEHVDPDRKTKQNINTCKANIHYRNTMFMENSSDDAKKIASLVREYATGAYSRSRIFQNFRKENIVIKVEAVQREDKVENWSAIDFLDEYCAANNVEIADLSTHRMFYIKNNSKLY
jgi:hypothetical protein